MGPLRKKNQGQHNTTVKSPHNGESRFKSTQDMLDQCVGHTANNNDNGNAQYSLMFTTGGNIKPKSYLLYCTREKFSGLQKTSAFRKVIKKVHKTP